MSIRGLLVLLAFTSCGAVACASDPEAFPQGITSLAVLPTQVVPANGLAAREVGAQLTAALQARTVFRIVGSDSTYRIFGSPESSQLFDHMRSEVITLGVVEERTAREIGARTNTQGLLLPRLSMALSGPSSGMLSLTVTAYDADQGLRIWQGYGQRAFAGQAGAPAFNRAVGIMVSDIVGHMPRPAGEEGQS